MVGCCVIVESIFLSVCAFITRFIYGVNQKVVFLYTYFLIFYQGVRIKLLSSLGVHFAAHYALDIVVIYGAC